MIALLKQRFGWLHSFIRSMLVKIRIDTHAQRLRIRSNSKEIAIGMDINSTNRLDIFQRDQGNKIERGNIGLKQMITAGLHLVQVYLFATVLHCALSLLS
jgi:hypothetical protein